MAKNVPLTHIAIKPATKLIFLMSVFYSITLILIFCCDIAWYLKIVLCLMILMNSRIYFQRHLLQTSSQAVISFWKTSADFWCLHFANSEVLFANLHFPCVVTRYITILKFYTEERKTVFVIITPGCIGKNEYCKLCGYLSHS
jgi:hypothetical protein